MLKSNQNVVSEEDLVEAARQFPLVFETCLICRGHGSHSPTVHGIEQQCDRCKGQGGIVRYMETREEHHYILHLLRTKYIQR